MRIVMFCHSIRSDWNHGNAHFVRGVLAELVSLGHDVLACEPAAGWSAENLRRDEGESALHAYREVYPQLKSLVYTPTDDVRELVRGADLVVVHEWTDPALLHRLNEIRREGAQFLLFFHDTHHRMVSAPEQMVAYDLSAVDAVLAFGETLRREYVRSTTARAYTWHEAAETNHFAPRPGTAPAGDLVWIGNWGDDERTNELEEYLLEPVRQLRLKAKVYGVRYPASALARLAECGIEYGGYLPNLQVPEVFAQYRVTVHVPRRPYARALPGIPTIRVFEALACGIPLISAPWADTEELFTEGEDYLRVSSGHAMTEALGAVLADRELAHGLSLLGRRTILARHTCRHRATELLDIVRGMTRRPTWHQLGGAA